MSTTTKPTDTEILDWLERNHHRVNQIEAPGCFPEPYNLWTIYEDVTELFYAAPSFREAVAQFMAGRPGATRR